MIQLLKERKKKKEKYARFPEPALYILWFVV